MEQVVYERPREKLRIRGVTSLTNTELLQLIIGSGTAQMPVAKMARKVNELIEKTEGSLHYETLKTISGIGDATICRILAALQYGARRVSPSSNNNIFNLIELRSHRKKTIVYSTLNGEMRPMQSYVEKLDKTKVSPILARQICAKVLADSASGVIVAVFNPSDKSKPDLFEMGLVSDLQDMTQRLQIRLARVEYITKTRRECLYRGTL